MIDWYMYQMNANSRMMIGMRGEMQPGKLSLHLRGVISGGDKPHAYRATSYRPFFAVICAGPKLYRLHISIGAEYCIAPST